MGNAYAWTDKKLPAPTRASGFDAGNGGSDAKRKVERLQAENADLTKTMIGMKDEMRNMMEMIKDLTAKKPAKKGAPAGDEPAGI